MGRWGGQRDRGRHILYIRVTNAFRRQQIKAGASQSSLVLFFYSMPVVLNFVAHKKPLGNLKNADTWIVPQF